MTDCCVPPSLAPLPSGREQSESSAWAGRSSAARYYQAAGGPGGGAGGAGGGAIAAEREKGEFEGLAPGQLSAELRAAMGIGGCGMQQGLSGRGKGEVPGQCR